MDELLPLDNALLGIIAVKEPIDPSKECVAIGIASAKRLRL